MVPQNQWEDEIDLGSVAGGCNLVISGPITSETISTLKSKLTAAGTSAKLHLDLSQTTGLTSIFYRAFYDCDRLSSVEIPAGVTSIGSEAFYDCDGLASVEIPASVTSIERYAFSGCSGLTSVTFGDTSGWYVTTSETGAANKTGGTAVTLSSTDLAANAKLVNGTYYTYYWYKVD